MPITNENVNMDDWNNATRLLCPHLKYLCGVWLALKENPCGKHAECNVCAQSTKSKVVVIQTNTERMKMEKLIEKLKEQREEQAEGKEIYNKLFEKFKETHKALIDSIENTNLVIGGLTTDIKAEALEEYKKTGNKKQECGVGIRVVSRMNYEPEKAFEWAKKHEMALTLDKRVFEKHAKVENLDFVEITETATATIPMKL